MYQIIYLLQAYVLPYSVINVKRQHALHTIRFKQYKRTLFVIPVFAVIGAAVFIFVRAATASVTLEAESAALSGSAAVASDPTASGQKSLKFSAPSGGGATPNCSGETPGALQSDHEFTGTTTGVTVPFSINLPADYYTACKEYPIIYTLHGKDASNATFIDSAATIRDAMTDGVLSSAIIVTPDSYNDGRWENGTKGPAEDNFIQELIPYVEAHYRVQKGASNRLLTGFSMGGHGAFRFGVKYPQMFAAVLSFDGAMSGNNAYDEFVPGVKQYQPKITTVGAQLCGARVEGVINAYAAQGVTIPYVYYDIEHSYDTFIQTDKQRGWPSIKFLQSNLGRAL